MKRFLLALCLFLLLPACSGTERMPGWLYLRLSSDPSTLDPALIVDLAGGGISAKLFNGLVRFGNNAEIVNDLASSWEISPDGRTYTFHIKDGVKFSNGRELNAADFKYSFERVLSPKVKSSRTWLFDRIEGAKDFMDGKASEVSGIKADGLTLKITLAEPFGPFLGLLAMPGAYVVPKEEVEKWGEDFSDHPAGTGPYVLKEWKHGSRLLLEAHGDYFGEKPQVAGIYYRVIPEELTSVAEFERGNLDIIGVPASEYRRYTTDPTRRGRILAQVGMNTYYMGMNCSRPPFDNLKLRQAASMAVDRGRLLSTIMEGRGLLADGPVPPVLLPGMKGGAPAFDPEAARRLVKEAGFPDGVDIKFYIGPEQETLDMAEVIQQYLASAGIRAHITQLEWSAYKQAINNGDADAFWMSWQADYPDPENFLYPVFFSKNAGAAGNRARVDDPEFDRLITLAQKEPDESKRMALYADAQARIVMAAPWVFFWHKKDVVAVQPWVRGAALYPISNADKGLGIALERR